MGRSAEPVKMMEVVEGAFIDTPKRSSGSG